MSYFMEGFPVLFKMAANSFLVLSVGLLIYFLRDLVWFYFSSSISESHRSGLCQIFGHSKIKYLRNMGNYMENL